MQPGSHQPGEEHQVIGKAHWPQHLKETVRHGFSSSRTTRSRAGPPSSPCWAGRACSPSCPSTCPSARAGCPPSLSALLLIPTVFTHLRGHHNINRVLGLTVAAVETFFMLASLFKLVGPLVTPACRRIKSRRRAC